MLRLVAPNIDAVVERVALRSPGENQAALKTPTQPTANPSTTRARPGRQPSTLSMKPSVSASSAWLRAETSEATAMVKKPSIATAPPVAWLG